MHFLILSLTRVTRFREVNNSITGRAWQTSNGSICLFVIRVIDDDQHGTMERHENLAGRTWQTDKFQPFANSTFSPPGFSTKLPNFWRVHPPQVHPAQLLWSSRWGITVCGSISFIPFSSDSPKENVIGLANLQDRVNSFFLSFHEWRMFTLQLLTNKSGKIYQITTVEIRNIFQDRTRDRDESEIINIPAFKIR